MTEPRDLSFVHADAGLFDGPVVIALTDRRAAEDIAAGRVIGSDAVRHWLACWGSDLSPIPSPCDE